MSAVPFDTADAVYVDVLMKAHQPYAFEPQYAVVCKKRVSRASLSSVPCSNSSLSSISMQGSQSNSESSTDHCFPDKSLKTKKKRGPQHGSDPRQRFICRDFVIGACRRGVECRFNHPEAAETKPEYCKDYEYGTCSRKHCRFVHRVPHTQRD